MALLNILVEIRQMPGSCDLPETANRRLPLERAAHIEPLPRATSSARRIRQDAGTAGHDSDASGRVYEVSSVL